MPWVRLDEEFTDHPKVVTAGPLAMAMQVAALCYCNRNLTDGFVPRSSARTLLDWEIVDSEGRQYTVGVTCGMSGNDVTCDWVIGLLVEFGMWEEVAGGYRVHDYHDYQPSKADVLAERKAKAEAGRKGGLASAARRVQAGAQAESKQVLEQNPSTCSTNPQAESKPVSVPVTDESQSQKHVTPQPSKALCLVPPEPPPPTASARSLNGFEPFWNAYPRRDGKRLGRTKAEQYWRRMTTAERAAATVGAMHLANAIAGGGKFGPPDAERWLRDRKWVDWQEPAEFLRVSNGQSALMRAQARGNQ